MVTARSKRQMVPVTTRALVQRINRSLAKQHKVLKKARGARALEDLGAWFYLDTNRNVVLRTRVDVEGLGRELGVLDPYEKLTEE
jgi:hypothetical protein